jgi:hypothetical protein
MLDRFTLPGTIALVVCGEGGVMTSAMARRPGSSARPLRGAVGTT